jgi:Na+/H+ antiporter NhaD/arsenite permease-like protein
MVGPHHLQHPAITAESKSPLPIASLCVIVGVVAVVVCYALSLLVGWPQRATALIVDEMHATATAAQAAPPSAILSTEPEHPTAAQLAEKSPPPLYTITPFVLMLAAIAVIPLLHGAKHWWENNLHRFYVAGGLAALTVLYYALAHHYPIVGHFPARHVSSMPQSESFHLGTIGDLLANALLNEYVPFIVLLFCLYTISGGIRIEGDLRAHSLTNVAFLAIGAILASFIGTTGAAMVLIRPLLETNRERKHVAHTVVIFTFIVCNCGGCLLPLGDPPLFLGYLQGVPFLWTLSLWKQWLFVNAALLAIYWAWDHFYFYPHEEQADLARDETRRHRLRFAGLQLNGLLLVGVILAVAFLDPSKAFPGTDWHPWLYLREVAMLVLLALSLVLGSAHTRKMNDFNFSAIIEVAVLFFGIFICMQPALQILNAHGAELGLNNPCKFFWGCGTLSSFLDNAPTYLVFFETANALTHSPGPGILALQSGHFIREDLLSAISLGAVFMGSMTYIGNGPNFMVKSIAESWGVRMPSFFGYMVYSCLILLPLLVLLNILFL